MVRVRLYPILSVILLVSFLLSACGGTGLPTQPQPSPTPERATYTVQRGDITSTLELTGQVTYRVLESVSFQMGGRVKQVFVNKGDRVTQGQLLAELEELGNLQLQVEAAGREVRVAQINLEVAQMTLEKYKKGGYSAYDIKMQELAVELKQIEYEKVLAKYELDPDSEVPVLDQLNAGLDKARVFAPSDGIILSAVDIDQVISNTAVAFTIGDGIQLEVIAPLDIAQIEALNTDLLEGMPVVVLSQKQMGMAWSGTLRQLPSPYGTGSPDDFSAYAILDQSPAPDGFDLDDLVTLQIQLATRSDVLWLPPEAIRRVGTSTFVLLITDLGQQAVDVELGLETPDKVEILSGLEEGQVVLGQ